MKHSMRIQVVAALLLLAVAWPLPAAQAQSEPQLARKVVIVSMPAVGWIDAERGDVPNLMSLAEEGSIAAMSLRTIGTRTDLGSALASIGAGNRARSNGIRPSTEGDADAAPNAVSDGTGGVQIRAFEQVVRDNSGISFGAEPGLLGETLHEHGYRTAVVGNADGGFVYPTAAERKGSGLERRRFGALAVADFSGSVDVGFVGDDLVTRDASTMNGYRAHSTNLLDATKSALDQADVVLVELSDTFREVRVAHGWMRRVRLPREPVREVQAAVRRDDAMLGRIARELDLEQDTLIVVGTTAKGSTKRETMTIAAMFGVGAQEHGWLTSATTRRPGLVTISDIGPGVLRLLGIDAPESMSGQPVHSLEGAAEGRVERMLDMQNDALFHGDWVSRFYRIFVGLQVVLYAIALLMLSNRRFGYIPWMRWPTLAFMAMPASTLLLVGIMGSGWGFLSPWLTVAAVAVAITALALWGPWRKTPTGPPTFVCAVTALLIVGDLVTGARLQLSSLLGYSPIVAGRFYGIGNLAFAVLATSSILLAAQLGARRGKWGWMAAAVLGVLTVVANGSPQFGADFGGILALVPAFGVLLYMLAGRRITLTRLVMLVILGGAAAVGAGALDMLRPPDQQTHLGRFVARLLEGGPGAVSDVVTRKIRSNWALLSSSFLTLSVPVALSFLGLLLFRPFGKLKAALQTQPGLREGLWAAIAVNFLGFAFNDSGIAIPAMGLAIIAPYCLATVLGLRAEDEQVTRS